MSTLKVAAINNPSASSGGLAISASGNVTGAGLDLITTQSFSAVSSVSINNCFSGDYDNYRVLVFSTTASGAVDLRFRMRTGGADDTSANYSNQFLDGTNTTVSAARLTGQTLGVIGSSSTSGGWVSIDVYRPFIAAATCLSSVSAFGATGPGATIYSAAHNVATSYSSITFLPGSSTLTGSVSVYGYKK